MKFQTSKFSTFALIFTYILLLHNIPLVNSTIGLAPLLDTYTTSVYQCIRQQGYENSVQIVVYGEDGIHEDYFLPSLYAMKNAGLSISIIYMVGVNLDPLVQVN